MNWQFEAIGTRWQIEVGEPMESEVEAACRQAIQDRIAAFDKAYSRFRADSLVSAMARSAGRYVLPEDAPPLLELYRQLYEATDGAVTPLIGQVLVDAGYDARYSLQAGPLTRPPAWDEAMAYDGSELVMHQPVLLDVGAAGKGYLVDLVAEIVEQYGAANYCVDAGGDMRMRGRPWRVGLEHPRASDEVIGVATVANASICGSAGNRRAWGEFHHIIDPHSLRSPRRVQAVWVAAATTLLADALTTALFFVSPERLVGQFEFEWLMLDQHDRVALSSGFPAELFTAS